MTDAELDRCRHDGALLRSIVSDQVELKREGRDWKGCCPFHAEKTGSFTVYEDGHFHCYGCGVHGTVFDFVMKRDGVEFPEAAKRVAAEIGSPSLPKPKPTNSNGTHKGTLWQPIVPPPADAPPPTADQLRCDMLHEYRDANDRVLCYVRRFEAKPGKGKLFLPLTYGTLDGKTGWHTKAPDKPKPLYGLNRLHAALDASVVLCEGEKAADAAQRLFPDMVAMAWMGGAKAEGGADLTPLAGRNVIIWGDADGVGGEAVARLAKRLPAAHTVDPADLPDGFDAADLERDGCADPKAWLAERKRVPVPPETEGREEHFSGPEPEPDEQPDPAWNQEIGPNGETEPPPHESEDEDFVLPIEFSENSLSYLFSERHQDRLVYVHGWGKWLRYHAGRWHEDYTVRVYDAARAICAEQGERALHTLPAKSARKVASIINRAGCVAAIERLARHHEPQTRDRDLFDADQTLVGGPNQHSKLQRTRRK